jgi:hypothetical protein
MKNSAYYEGLSELGIISRKYCSREENKKFSAMRDDELPDDVYPGAGDGFDDGTYRRYSGMDIPDDKLRNYVAVKTALNVKTIKYCAVFFAVLAAISLVLLLVNMFFNK